MPRVKRGVIAHKKREKLLKKTKGYRWGRKSKERAAKEALLHGLSRKFKGRKEKKRDYRRLWIVRINAAARGFGLSYSRFIAGVQAAGIEIDRKALADIAVHDIAAFGAIAEKAKAALAAK